MTNMRMIRCRGCGGTGRIDTAWDSEKKDGKYGVVAICKDCLARTPVCRSMNEAVAEWNEGNISRTGEYRLSLFWEASDNQRERGHSR